MNRQSASKTTLGAFSIIILLGNSLTFFQNKTLLYKLHRRKHQQPSMKCLVSAKLLRVQNAEGQVKFALHAFLISFAQLPRNKNYSKIIHSSLWMNVTAFSSIAEPCRYPLNGAICYREFFSHFLFSFVLMGNIHSPLILTLSSISKDKQTESIGSEKVIKKFFARFEFWCSAST